MLSSKKHSGFYSPPGSHSTVDRVAKTAQQPFMTVIWKKQNKCSVTEIPPPLWLKFRTGEWRSHTTTTIIQSAWLLLVDHFFQMDNWHYWAFCRSLYTESQNTSSEGTHKGHGIQLLAPHNTTQKSDHLSECVAQRQLRRIWQVS